MANEAKSQAPESTQSTRPANRRRPRKIANLTVELAGDFDLCPVVEPWERDLILLRLARWLDNELASMPARRESSHDE